MTEKRKAAEALDACPFPPDSERPGRGLRTGLLNYYEELFGNWKLVASILTAASLVLAYSLLIVPPSIAPSVSVPDSWGRPIPEYTYTWIEKSEWKPRFENQVVHEGDLIIKGTEVLEIEDCSYFLDGVMLVKDNARLILRNAELSVGLKTGWYWLTDLLPSLSYHILFTNTSRFEAFNSTIFYPEHGLGIGFRDSSGAIMETSNFSRAIIYCEDGANIEISDSIVGDVNVWNSSGCQITNSEVSSISCRPEWDPYFRWVGEEPWDRCIVEVWNSTVEDACIRMENHTTAKISTPFQGFHRHWNPRMAYGGVEGSVFNLTLHDTNVTGRLSLFSFSGSLEIENEHDLKDLYVYNGSSRVSNCTILYMNCGEGSEAVVVESVFWGVSVKSDAKLSISRSKIGAIYLDRFEGDTVFDDVFVDRFQSSLDCNCSISGSMNFDEKATARMGYGAIKRNFKVQTQREERVLLHVRLVLFDKEGTQVWSGETGRDGKADFNTTFCCIWPIEPFKFTTNYEDVWKLEASLGDLIFNVYVSLLSDTPIVLVFPTLSKQPFWMRSHFLTAASFLTIVVTMVAILLRRLTPMKRGGSKTTDNEKELSKRR